MLLSSSEPPWASGTIWSGTVASRTMPRVLQTRQSGSALRRHNRWATARLPRNRTAIAWPLNSLCECPFGRAQAPCRTYFDVMLRPGRTPRQAPWQSWLPQPPRRFGARKGFWKQDLPAADQAACAPLQQLRFGFHLASCGPDACAERCRQAPNEAAPESWRAPGAVLNSAFRKAYSMWQAPSIQKRTITQ